MRRFCTWPINVDPVALLKRRFRLRSRIPGAATTAATAWGSRKWLAAATGEPYRLLSEAEWEYACRAGTRTRYSWGDEITPEHANYGNNAGRTREVGSSRANAWGLYDAHGTVWEWVEDCWNDRRRPTTVAPGRTAIAAAGCCAAAPGGRGYGISARPDAAVRLDKRIHDFGFRVATTFHP